MASGFTRTESGFVDETRNGETDDVEGMDVTAQSPCDVGDNVDVILSDEHFKTAQTFSQHVVFGTWLFYMVGGLCLVRGYSTWWTGCVWYVAILHDGRVVFGMWLFTSWTSCVWYVAILHGGRVVFGMWLFYKVDWLCLVCGYSTWWTSCV